MPCKNPFVLVQGDWRRMVACGQCRECRTRRKQAWVGRMRLELDDAQGVGRFLTLTYRHDPGILSYSHIQLFLKRYRYHYGPCRYFAVGEYGDRFGRGHWHVLAFGHPPEVEKPGFLDNFQPWTAGLVYDGFATVESIGYCAGYVMKPGSRTALKRPITRMSLRPGLGLPHIEAMAQQFAASFLNSPPPSLPSTYRYGGRDYPLYGGGRMAFERAYLAAGGQPPIERSELELDLDTIAHLTDFVGRAEMERIEDQLYQNSLGYKGGIRTAR